ncbi:MAG: hypothetical protein R2749_04725 [Acidimicrobiales bacterium]
MTEARLALAVASHQELATDLATLRAKPMAFLEPVPEPAQALRWLERGGSAVNQPLHDRPADLPADLADATASQLLAGFSAGSITPVDAVEACLARIAATEPACNAIILCSTGRRWPRPSAAGSVGGRARPARSRVSRTA